MRLEVLRERSALSAIARDCADLALHCTERSRLDQSRAEGTRIVLVRSANRLEALFPFSAPAPYCGLPLIALRTPMPLVRTGSEERVLHALLDWFRRDGEGAALLELRSLAPRGPVYRALARVAGEREQQVLEAKAADGSRTLLVGDRAWHELSRAALPLERWAKRRAASLVFGTLDL